MTRQGRPARGALRVVAGELAGRRFDAPTGSSTRPTADRVRQATFNALDSMGAVEGARVIDPFAGSGALGIEALSRHAAHAAFADTDRMAVEVVGSNLRALGLEGRASVRCATAEAVLAEGAWDLVLLDPPYAYDGWSTLLVRVLEQLAPDGVAIIESPQEVSLPPGLECVRAKTYGGTVVQIVARAGAPT
jgi:16S rRNA (guanine966-N2)-methyltransferase